MTQFEFQWRKKGGTPLKAYITCKQFQARKIFESLAFGMASDGTFEDLQYSVVPSKKLADLGIKTIVSRCRFGGHK